jgi:predicted kinase
MKPKVLYLCVGIPGSGKSTWARENANRLNAVVVSRDAIRFSILNDEDGYFDKETLVFNLFVKDIQHWLDNGMNVIADATHLSGTSRNKVLNSLDLWNVNVVPVWFNTPLDVCLERNEQRTGRAFVPRGVIRRMNFQMQPPTYKENIHFTSIMRVKGDPDPNDLLHQ